MLIGHVRLAFYLSWWYRCACYRCGWRYRYQLPVTAPAAMAANRQDAAAGLACTCTARCGGARCLLNGMVSLLASQHAQTMALLAASRRWPCWCS
jgi:hypothetical protein